MKKSFHIGVIGSGSCSDATFNLARDVGSEIGKRGWTLVCGGLGGVMEGASKGCLEADGMTIGPIPAHVAAKYMLIHVVQSCVELGY